MWIDTVVPVARVMVDNHDLSLELVRAGLAWHFVRYSSDRMLAQAEREARGATLGLWRTLAPHPRGSGAAEEPSARRPLRPS